jgi:hypothetical protein
LAQVLTFLHTSPAHIPTFDRLVQAIDPTLEVRHVVNEPLLHEAQAAGEVTPGLAQRITGVILAEIDKNPGVVLCTCSTIGPIAEKVNQVAPGKVVRVDRPMAEQAVTLGNRIVVLAALAITFGPTRQLIQEAADQAGKPVEIIELFCETAWPKFKQGDKTGYLHEIAAYIELAAGRGDVIVLAQASMAGAEEYCQAPLDVPVLSSPRLGLEAAIRLLKQGPCPLIVPTRPQTT